MKNIIILLACLLSLQAPAQIVQKAAIIHAGQVEFQGGTVGVGSALPAGTAPTAGVVNDALNTFDWTYVSGKTSLSDYEQTVDNGVTVTAVSAKPIAVGDVAKAIGDVRVRLKAIAGVSTASAWLSNASAYTVAGGGGVTVLYTQNFDTMSATAPAVPAGWVTNGGFITTATTNISPAVSLQYGKTSTEYYAYMPVTATADGTFTYYFRADNSNAVNATALIARSTGASLTGVDQYRATAVIISDVLTLKLQTFISGVLTDLTTVAVPTAGSGEWFKCSYKITGTSHTVQLQRVSTSFYLSSGGAWQSTATNAISTTNGAITTAGLFGLYAVSTSSGTPDNYIDNLTITSP